MRSKWSMSPAAAPAAADFNNQMQVSERATPAAHSGYHSSPSLAFLMTFFNVRLGYWAGNPRHDETWKLPGPRFGLGQLLAELFGLTDDEAKYVFLDFFLYRTFRKPRLV